MRSLNYALQTAFKSLWHEKWINLLTILSISLSLLILSAFATLTINTDSVLKRWSKSFGLVVYLKDGVNKDTEEALKTWFRKDPDIIGVNYISKEQAVEELKDILGEDAGMLDELRENPLPSSLELRLKSELLDPDAVRRKAEQIKQMNGVDEVRYGDKWLASLDTATRVMKISAAFLGFAILLAIIFITYNTIRILFYRRSEEIETLKLLGATKTFIRLPFLIESLFIGVIGGIGSSAALYSIQSFISYRGVAFLPSIKTIMVSLPLEVYLAGPILGAIMSLAGCFIAVGKIRY